MKRIFALVFILSPLALAPCVSYAQNQAIPYVFDNVTSADAIRPVQVSLSSHVLAVIENGYIDTSGNLETYHRNSTGNSWQKQGILPAPGMANSVDVDGCFMAVGKSGQVDIWGLKNCDSSSKPFWQLLHQVEFTNSVYSSLKVDLDYNNGVTNVPRFAVLVDRPGDYLNPPGAAVYVYEMSGTTFVRRAELTMIFTNELLASSSYVETMALRGERIVLAAPSEKRIAIHARNQGGDDAWGLVTSLDGPAEVSQFGYDLAMDNTRIIASERLSVGGSRIAVYTNSLPAGNAWSRAGILLEPPSGLETLGVSLDGARLAVLGLPEGSSGTGELFAQWWIYNAGAGPGGWSLQRQGDTVSYRPAPVFFITKPSLAADRLALGLGGTNVVGRLTGSAATILRADAGGANQWGVEQIFEDQGTPTGLGDALSMSKTMMVSGMPRDNGSGTNSGSAYVWALADSDSFRGWVPTAKLTDPVPEPGHRFGESVAIYNQGFSLIAVGSPGVFSNKGSVTTFKTVIGGQFEPGQELEPSFHTNASRFGAALAMHDNWMAIGAPDYPGGGAVYIANYSGGFTGTWEIARTNFPASNGVGYGSRVAMSGIDLAITRPFTNGTGRSVFMYRKDAGGTNAWGLTQTLLPPAGSPSGFGESVALLPNTNNNFFSILAVGATGSVGQTGSVLVYYRGVATTNVWTPLVTLIGPADDGPTFGSSLAFSDYGLLAVGAPGAGTGGRVRLYSVLGWPAPSTNGIPLATRNGATGEQLGKSVAADSIYTVAGAPLNGTNGPNSGALHSFRVGSYEYWAGQQTAGFASAWLPHQDYDGDGHFNLMEFAMGSDPSSMNSESLFTMNRVTQSGLDYIAWTRPEPPHETLGLAQFVSVSTNLNDWWTTTYYYSLTNSRTALFRSSLPFQHHRLELRYPVFDIVADEEGGGPIGSLGAE